MSTNANNNIVKSNRTIYTASQFAKSCLLHLQETGESQTIKPHKSTRVGLHSYLLFVVLDGKGTLVYNGLEYSLQTNDCVFINCQIPYTHYSSDNHLWTLRWIHFYGPNINDIYAKYIERGGHPVFTPSSIASFQEMLAQIQEIASSENYIRDMILNEKITSLLTLVMAESWHPENRHVIDTKKQSLHNILRYLEEHYNEHITLDKLANMFYINKFYLTRIFKEQYGISINSYLSQIRITHAKQLLRFSTLTIEQIGKEVGIEEPGYFNRFFKKIEGVTPGEYRKRW